MAEIPKAELMRRLRKERREQGLVEFRAWVKPDIRQQLTEFLKQLQNNNV